MPEHHTGQLGGTMRLGKRRTNFKTDKSLMSEELFSYFDLVLLICFAVYSMSAVVLTYE